MKFQVGDEVVIVYNTGHNFKIGSLCKITKLPHLGDPDYEIEGPWENKIITQWLRGIDFRKLTKLDKALK